MQNSKCVKKNRIAAGIMGFMILFTVLFSAVYITLEADHDCECEDCPICVCLQHCEKILFQSGEVFSYTTAVVPVICLLLLSILFKSSFLRETPVTKKVRLNN